MKAIAALVITLLGAAIAGCAYTRPAAEPVTTPPLDTRSAQSLAESIAARVTASAAALRPGPPVRFRTIEYSSAVMNAGAPGAFTAFVRGTQTVTVQPSSAATVGTRAGGSLMFTSPADRERWQADGRPALAVAPPAGQTQTVPAGQFSFIPQGSPLTYWQASTLPESAGPLRQRLLGHLEGMTGSYPAAGLILSELGYVLATAPLTSSARVAVWHLLTTLSGLQLCGRDRDLAHRQGLGLCVSSGGQQSELLIDTTTGSVLAVEDRLIWASDMYPLVRPGALVSSTAFVVARQ